MNHSESFKYFENKFYELTDKYRFNYLDISPCHIKSKEDVTSFIEQLGNTLFKEAEISFVDNEEIDEGVNFLFNGQPISLKVDPQYGHIQLDFSKTVKRLGKLAGKLVTHVHPFGMLVSGDMKDMKAAWSEGFPITLNEIDFLHGNVNGKWFKRKEVRSSFILDEV